MACTSLRRRLRAPAYPVSQATRTGSRNELDLPWWRPRLQGREARASSAQSRWGPRGSPVPQLPVGVLAGDLVTPELEQVAAAHHDRLPLGGRPGQQPLRAAPVAADPVAVVALVAVGDAGEATRQSRSHGLPALEPPPPRLRPPRHLQHLLDRRFRPPGFRRTPVFWAASQPAGSWRAPIGRPFAHSRSSRYLQCREPARTYGMAEEDLHH